MSFTALVLRREDVDAPPTVAVETLDAHLLPSGDDLDQEPTVTVDVTHSSLNYKDALVLAGSPGLVRSYPHVPGIDLAGTVASSEDPAFSPGDEVLATGCWLGERHWGGMTTRARVRASCLVHRPAGMDAHRAMALGTAGLTAQLCLDALLHGGVGPSAGPVLVTGATGGVGSLAVHLLARAGYEVEAATGSAEDPTTAALLTGLGATRILPRTEVSRAAGRALAGGRWAGVVDVAGGAMLAGALAQTLPNGVVAACGLVDDTALHTTVMPFIVRGVTLAGIESVHHPMEARPRAWQQLHRTFDATILAQLTTTVTLSEVPDRAADLLDHGVRGRTVVKTIA